MTTGKQSVSVSTNPYDGLEDPGLRISTLRTWVLEAPIHPPVRIATVTYTKLRATCVEVELANGAVGWGECLVREAPSATRAIIEEVLAPVVVGENAGRVQAIWEKMYRLFRTRGHSRGILPEAISGVDTAIWDALGRSSGRPIVDLLYGAGRQMLPCYASSILVVDERTTAQETERLLGQGYRGIKVKVGQDVRLDARRIKLVRDIVGDDIEVMVDANASFSLADSLAFMRLIRDAEVSWLEEPLVADDLPGYRKLAAAFPEVPLAAGEAEFTTAGFREFCEGRILTVFQPDVARAGGITGVMRVANLANAYNIPMSSHVGFSSGISGAAAVQVAAAITNFRIHEHMYMEHPLQDVFLDPFPSPVESQLQVPRGPGLGLEIDTSKVQRLSR